MVKSVLFYSLFVIRQQEQTDKKHRLLIKEVIHFKIKQLSVLWINDSYNCCLEYIRSDVSAWVSGKELIAHRSERRFRSIVVGIVTGRRFEPQPNQKLSAVRVLRLGLWSFYGQTEEIRLATSKRDNNEKRCFEIVM